MKFEEHMQECIDKLGGDPAHVKIYEEVNKRIDQFAHFPDWNCLKQHRQFLHHQEGVAYFGRRYGEIGRLAAELHVRSDCGMLPKAEDYYNGVCDGLGRLTVKAKSIFDDMQSDGFPV